MYLCVREREIKLLILAKKSALTCIELIIWQNLQKKKQTLDDTNLSLPWETDVNQANRKSAALMYPQYQSFYLFLYVSSVLMMGYDGNFCLYVKFSYNQHTLVATIVFNKQGGLIYRIFRSL